MRISDWSSDVCSSDLGDIFVATTVLLESEWVLRSGYGFAPAQVADGLSGLAGLPGVTVAEPGLLARAIEWLRDGVDFADALHLAKAGDCDVFLSFDRKLDKVARTRAPIPVRSQIGRAHV